MNRNIRIYVLADRMEDSGHEWSGLWTACADWDGSVQYDGTGMSPAEAFARLAENMATELAERDPPP